MSTTYATHLDSPLGVLTLLSDGESLTGLFMPSSKGNPAVDPAWGTHTPVFDRTAEQLAGYFRGELRTFDVPLAPAGTPFQQRVWSALREIPYGETRSYRDIAIRIGAPTAVRAVGLANGRNPLSVIVPCHRVVGSNGALTGYGGGLHNKQLLLDLERRSAGAHTLLDQLSE